jgi:Zn finger protein HypA/HybF involved in hydrogenase expression
MSQPDAEAIANKAGFIPLETFKGRHYPWKCRCVTCNQVIYPYLGGMLQGNGCLNCSGLIIDPVDARNLMIQNNIEPIVEYPGAGVPWQSKCMKCNREVSPRYSSIKMKIGGCKYCASHGYDFSAPGVLYLVTHLELEAHKIGITNINAKEKRLEKHSKQGWIIYDKWLFENGNNAFEVEQELLLWIREDLSLPVYLGKAQMPQGGFTETVDAKEIELSEIVNKVRMLADKYRGSSKYSDFKTSMLRRGKGS